ncbi:concanavalin A-like lectin/glucanase domain-containing protein [Massariosphaeria phaeospora]|uniref:Concanavalin A-like lectin/glucanase domain-containing protein n=1 Tax=Massariosphaeria phaeospora TaxID=100035 RepID=A0A7C8INN7_9PLEO|nr:concanavalin A-like lectin/glucanase domain-containing protein [Massariosphaeria phaeospora]
MYITPRTLQTIVWSALTLSTARAQYAIDNLSFGQKEGQPISPNLRGVPHFHVKGDGYEPEILSDRIILTPPYPGNKRGALWTEDPLHHVGDWTAELAFRAGGMERGGGNMQIWYTKESQKNEPPASLYTAPQFDGLVLVIDQYEGRGGSIRGFLNDGSIDIKAHSDPDTLAFGQCNYAYRNLGRLSVIKMKQANGNFEVTVDDHPCFSTDKVRLPENYYFGISASSAENPDSFEVHKFVVSTTNAYTREEPVRNYQSPDAHAQQNIQQQQQQQNQQQNQQQQYQQPADGSNVPQMLQDVLAANIRSQQDQFADLHNRIQIINHRVNDIYDMLEKRDIEDSHRFNDLMARVVPSDDRSAAMIRNVEKVERTTMEILRDLESKDFKDMMNAVHDAIENSHNALNRNMLPAMAHIVGEQKPSIMTFLFIAVAVQVMVFGAYRVYKARRNNAPKKYL